MHDIHPLVEIIASPVVALTSWKSAFSAPYLLSGALVAMAVYAALRRGCRRSLAGAIRFALPQRILRHPSALLDYKYFLFGMMLRSAMLGGMLVSSVAVSAAVGAALGFLWSGGFAVAPWFGIGVVTVTYVLAFDLGYWVGHRLLHEFPLLWEFHKPHHAAEVLTPATAARAHPVEDIVQANCIGIVTGLAHGFTTWLFGPAIQPLTLLGTNVLLLLFYVTIFHLRHSHVWLPVGGWLAHIIQSPAHHQIHHSDDPRHMGKNLGFCLSIWDWAFGTLYIPGKKEALTFGIGAESKEFRTVTAMLLRPFANAGKMLLPGHNDDTAAPASRPDTVSPIRL